MTRPNAIGDIEVALTGNPRMRIIGAVMGVLAALGTVTYSLLMVLTGRGSDTYRGVRGMLIQHSSIVTFAATFLLCAIVALVWRIVALRRRRAIDEILIRKGLSHWVDSPTTHAASDDRSRSDE